MFLFGGWDGVKTLNDLWEFDLNTEKSHLILFILSLFLMIF